MTKLFSIVAVLGLSACMGGGGGSSSGSNDIEVSLAEGFGTLLNETRTSSDLNLDARLVSAAQIHADDMFARNYDTVEVMGETIMDPVDGNERAKDLGDIVRDDANYDWVTIKELLAKGELTNDQALAFWNNEVCSGMQRCYDDPAYEDFGIAKAGSGSDQRWVLLLATER